MKIKGHLLGINTFESKKGTDCFFGNIATNYTDREPNGVGYKVVAINAFGEDANKLYKICMDGKLVDSIVEATGLYTGGSFSVVDIKASK